MPEMRIADFLRHDVQAYGVPGAPGIDRILQACVEAANYIDKLEYRIAQVERERDVVARDARIGTTCDTCKHVVNPPSTKPCIDCGMRYPFWEWRGVCAENTKEEGK